MPWGRSAEVLLPPIMMLCWKIGPGRCFGARCLSSRDGGWVRKLTSVALTSHEGKICTFLSWLSMVKVKGSFCKARLCRYHASNSNPAQRANTGNCEKWVEKAYMVHLRYGKTEGWRIYMERWRTKQMYVESNEGNERFIIRKRLFAAEECRAVIKGSEIWRCWINETNGRDTSGSES